MLSANIVIFNVSTTPQLGSHHKYLTSILHNQYYQLWTMVESQKSKTADSWQIGHGDCQKKYATTIHHGQYLTALYIISKMTMQPQLR
jgi:hypothetical protein